MERVYNDEKLCYGCSACANACPKGAITMRADAKGFLYPLIDQSLCVDCGKCQAVCQHGIAFANPEAKAIYALQHQDAAVVKESSSGGAFTLISNIVLEKGGAVFGCVIDENFDVIHTRAETKEERDRMRGSKYVQSDLREVFSEVKACLKTRTVLFVGTPCQVQGLYAYLEGKPDNLLTVDFLCHGTPSAKLFKDHVAFLEKRYNKSAVYYKFRDKKYGWRHVETIFFEGEKKKTSYDTFRLKHIFTANIALRASCYNCPYASSKRVADITIGDFWGAEQKIGRYENKGISLAMLNSERGRKVFSEIASEHCIAKVTLPDVMQRALQKPAPKPKNSDAFWELYLREGYERVTEAFSAARSKHYLRFGVLSLTVRLGLDKTITRIKAKIRERKDSDG